MMYQLPRKFSLSLCIIQEGYGSALNLKDEYDSGQEIKYFPAKNPVALAEWSTINGWRDDIVTLSFDSELKAKVLQPAAEESLFSVKNIPQYS